jgi:hypothetical protein
LQTLTEQTRQIIHLPAPVNRRCNTPVATIGEAPDRKE